MAIKQVIFPNGLWKMKGSTFPLHQFWYFFSSDIFWIFLYLLCHSAHVSYRDHRLDFHARCKGQSNACHQQSIQVENEFVWTTSGHLVCWKEIRGPIVFHIGGNPCGHSLHVFLVASMGTKGWACWNLTCPHLETPTLDIWVLADFYIMCMASFTYNESCNYYSQGSLWSMILTARAETRCSPEKINN